MKVTSFDFQQFYVFGPNPPSPALQCASCTSVSFFVSSFSFAKAFSAYIHCHIFCRGYGSLLTKVRINHLYPAIFLILQQLECLRLSPTCRVETLIFICKRMPAYSEAKLESKGKSPLDFFLQSIGCNHKLEMK